MTAGLVQFLGDRLKECAARANNWHDLECDIHAHLGTDLLGALATSRMLQEVPGAVCDCGGPARVLREVEAQRQVIDEHQDTNDGSCGTCVDGKWGYPTHGGSSPKGWPCTTLRHLAAVHSDHPDYLPEWRP